MGPVPEPPALAMSPKLIKIPKESALHSKQVPTAGSQCLGLSSSYEYACDKRWSIACSKSFSMSLPVLATPFKTLRPETQVELSQLSICIEVYEKHVSGRVVGFR